MIDGVSNQSAINNRLYTFSNVITNHTINVIFGNYQCNITLNLKVLIGGFYIGNGLMEAVLYNDNQSIDSTSCDSITVELHDGVNPDSIVTSSTGLLHTDGKAQLFFASYILNHSYYLIVRHRNALEIWSKNPVYIISPVWDFDFTSQ